MAVSFKVGDKVRLTQNCGDLLAGTICELRMGWFDENGFHHDPNTIYAFEVGSPVLGNRAACSCTHYWELVDNKTTTTTTTVGPLYGGGYKRGDELILTRPSKNLPGRIKLTTYSNGIWNTENSGRFTIDMLDDNYTELTNTSINSKKGEELFSKIKSKTMNLIKLAKDLTLPADEKLLRKVGLKTECGEYTNDAKEIVLQKLCEDNKDYLLKLAEEQEKENKNADNK